MFKRAPTDTSEGIGRVLGRYMNDLRDKIKANTAEDIREFIAKARETLREIDERMREVFVASLPPGSDDAGFPRGPERLTCWKIWFGRLKGCEEYFLAVEKALKAKDDYARLNRPGAIEIPRNAVVSAYAYFQTVSEGAIATIRLNQAHLSSYQPRQTANDEEK